MDTAKKQTSSLAKHKLEKHPLNAKPADQHNMTSQVKDKVEVTTDQSIWNQQTSSKDMIRSV